MTEWLTEKEAADYLNVPENKLRVARYRKKLPYAKVCGVVQYKKEWLDEFREGKCEEPQNSPNAQARLSGTSPFQRDGDQGDLAWARATVLKLNAGSRSSSSNAKPQSQPRY